MQAECKKECNKNAHLEKIAKRVRTSANKVQTECNKSAINNGPGGIDQRVQNSATQNAQTSARIDHIQKNMQNCACRVQSRVQT